MIEPRCSASNARVPRDGFTLAELMLVLVLLGMIMGTMITILTRQQRFYRSAADVMNTRGGLRDAIAGLPADLRGVSPTAGDFYSLSDHVVEFRSTTGSSILCAMTGVSTILIPPVKTTRDNVLTTWSALPVVGDSVFVYDDSLSSAAFDDEWRAYAIAAITPVSGLLGCPISSGYVQGTDTSQSSYSITLTAPYARTIKRGAPIRFYRRVHYELYQGADGLWYLGFYDCVSSRATPCNALQPASGPFRPYSSSSPATSGLLFSYFDSTGTELAALTSSAAQVARIRVAFRGQTRAAASLRGQPTGVYYDSLIAEVGLRNRR